MRHNLGIINLKLKKCQLYFIINDQERNQANALA